MIRARIFAQRCFFALALAALFVAPFLVQPRAAVAQGTCNTPPCAPIPYSCSGGLTPVATCTPISGCNAGCPASSLTFGVELPACDSGLRLDNSCLEVPKFNASWGTLKQVGVRVETRPDTIAYQVENISTQTARVPPAPNNTTYLAYGYLDVHDPLQPQNFISQTKDKVEGAGGTAPFCLAWSVSATLPAGQTIAPYDNCTDFADPAENGSGCAAGHGSLGVVFQDSPPTAGDPVCALCGTNTVQPSTHLGGVRKKYGVFSNIPPAPPLVVSGYSDKREFNHTDGVYPLEETYRCEKCYTLGTDVQQFVGTGNIPFQVDSIGGLAGINYQGGAVIQQSKVKMRCRITVTYNYCPNPPTCQPFTIDTCRTVGATSLVNVLSTVTVPTQAACASNSLDCSVLTGTQNVTQGTYGSVQWVNDASFVNPFCPGKGLKYTLNTLPPTNPAVDTFTYTVGVLGGCSTSCTVTINIASPVCAPDTADVCRTLGSLKNINVLANDSSPRPLNCGALTGTANVTQGTYGSVAWLTDASLTNALCNSKGVKYTLTSLPPVGVTTDTFNYTIVDSNGCTATCPVTVTIASPVCQPDTGNACRTIGSLATINVLANDTSLRPLTCATLTGTTGLTQGTYGSVAWATDAACVNTLCNLKCIKYTVTSLPPVGVTTDTFNYTITDTNGCTATCPVTVTVASPVCAPDTGDVCKTQGSMATINVLANDTSLRPLNCASLTGTTGLTQGTYGSVAWATDAACVNTLCNLKCIKYTLNTLPPVGVTTDTFNYTITDSNGCTATCPVTITIASPVCASDTAELCRTVSSFKFVNLLANDSSLRPLNCASLTGTTGLTQGTYGSTVWATDASCVNTLCNLKCVKYTLTSLPPVGVTTDTFQYTITDTNGCTSTCTVTVTIASPVCAPDTLDVCRVVGSMGLSNVLVNDTSLRPLNCGLLTGTAGLTQGTYGTVAWVTDASCVNTLCNLKCVKYTLTSLPPVGVTTDTFNYTITDTNGCTATCPVTVTISSPRGVDDCADLCAVVGSMVNINVLANDTSLRPLNCGLLTGTANLTQGTYGSAQWTTDAACVNALCNQKCIKYTLNTIPPGLTTTDSFTYTITDSNGCSVTITVVVHLCKLDAVNDGPIQACQGIAQPICVLANDLSTCAVLDCSNLSIAAQPAHGTVSIVQNCSALPTGCGTTSPACSGCCLVYTSESGFVGTDTFTYRLSVTSTSCPGGTPVTCTDTATVTMQVKPTPVAVDDAYELDLSGILQPFDVRDNDSPGQGCELVCGAPCSYSGCPTVIPGSGPLYGTLSQDLVTCKFTYTPTPGQPFPGSDRFCYRIQNSCGCCATACVTITNCPSINRRLPGSLLVFPEYDNRPGYSTILTITNTSCDFPANPAIVEILYINKNTCTEFNKTFPLTPCDTRTFVTNIDNPNPWRGYAYAYAKDAQGRPISFNYLIGDDLVLDAVNTYAYAVNAVSFVSPQRFGLLTDLDDDGIRDLDGFEYERAPDKLLVPRFFGQDLPGNNAIFRDELVLIALSGGVQFQTIVSFEAFNDNEVPFSAEYQFYCWEKVPLLTISGGFGNQFLKDLGDDPNEILGATSREAGWFRVDGHIAFSNLEEILDPAIYGFLVEQASGDKGAELPWELCAQRNGDLLPKDPLGDGPNPVNNDNQ